MKAKLILPAITEATSPYWRPIKYSLFPPLGLATLAASFSPDDDIRIEDEHVGKINLDDTPDLVVIQVYITSAYRSYEIADAYRKKGVFVALGGLHVTSLPEEAMQHANSIFLGPGDDIFPRFLVDYRNKSTKRVYVSNLYCIENLPVARRDLYKRHLYLIPNTIIVSKGCPHHCDFCYNDSFYKFGKSYMIKRVDKVLEEIEGMPGKHLFFMDDHLFGNKKFASVLFDGLKSMGRIWQAAGTVNSVLDSELFQKAVKAGLKSLFVGFETINKSNLGLYNKKHNIKNNYERAARIIHDNNVMINGSFVYGMDNDDPTTFERTVQWALENGIETGTFHILTPYPGTRLYGRMLKEKRMLSNNWDNYDTRHSVFQPRLLTPQQLETGYHNSYKEFYKWSSIFSSAGTKNSFTQRFKHVTYAGGWKKCEFLWHAVIKLKRTGAFLPILEKLLNFNSPHQKVTDTTKGRIVKLNIPNKIRA